MRFRSVLQRYLSAAIIAAASVAPGFAQEDAPRTADNARGTEPGQAEFTLTEEDLANPPERKLIFDEISTELERRLTRADPALLEKKFAAIFTVKLPSNTAFDPELTELNGLQSLNQSYLLFPHNLSVSRSRLNTLGESLRRIIDATAEDRRPLGKHLSSLKASPIDVETDVLRESGFQELQREFTIFAETAEEARTSAAALLKVLDNGLTRSYQLELFERRAEVLAQLDAEQKAFDATTAERERLRKEAKELADFPADLLPNLRVQQLQLEVDLAGTKSRIEACQKLLASDELKSEDRQAKVLDLRTAAEVDLASFEARQATIRQFVEKAKRSGELDRLSADATARLNAHRQQLNRKRSAQRSLEQRIEQYRPLPLVGSVTIRPLKWTQ